MRRDQLLEEYLPLGGLQIYSVHERPYTGICCQHGEQNQPLDIWMTDPLWNTKFGKWLDRFFKIYLTLSQNWPMHKKIFGDEWVTFTWKFQILLWHISTPPPPSPLPSYPYLNKKQKLQTPVRPIHCGNTTLLNASISKLNNSKFKPGNFTIV